MPIVRATQEEDGEVIWETYNFPDGKNDDRWYHWCVENWDTKWEDMLGIEVQDMTHSKFHLIPHGVHEGVIEKLREKFPELTFQCFYDEPGCEIAGYY